MTIHSNQPVVHAGAPVDDADAVMVMVHGRGAGPAGILNLVAPIDRPRVAYLAPSAAGGTWYPYSFLSPKEQNEPGLSSALAVLDSIILRLIDGGRPAHEILLLGFSQGACLASEFTIRHPRRYGGLLALSGGLIGPPGTTWDDVTTSLDGMPAFFGCSDVDHHIPKERVIESEHKFTRLDARVTRKLYPGMGHLVNEDEIAEVQAVIDEVLAAP